MKRTVWDALLGCCWCAAFIALLAWYGVALPQGGMGPGPGMVHSAGSCTNHTAIDGTAVNNIGSGVVLTATLTTSAAGFVVATFHANQSGTTIVSVIGSTLGAFTARGAVSDGGSHLIWTYGKASAGALTNEIITVTYSTAQTFATILAFGVSGTNSSYDANGGLPATNGAGADVLISTSNACDLIFTSYYVSGNTATAGATWTAVRAVSNFLFAEYKNTLTATQTNLDATISGDTPSVGIGDALQSN